MPDQYLQPLETITDDKHYFKFNSPLLDQYRQSYAENVRFLIDKLTVKQQKDLYLNKLFLKREFNSDLEKQFIQTACEITVTSYFAQRFPESFRYEPKLTKQSNSECQFKALGYTYNIEVKCPSFDRLEAQNLDNHFIFSVPIRTNRALLEIITGALNEAAEQAGLPSYTTPHRMDNNLKDFLKSANNKFKGANSENDINMLVVCCDNAKNMQEFTNYLYQYGGFFNQNPDHTILAPLDYKHVDVVILCNLYYRHARYYSKPSVVKPWDFSASFNLVFDNIHREV